MTSANFTNKIHTRNFILVLIVISVALLRIFNVGKFGNWANFTPVGAIALFAGTYFKDRWAAYLTPLLVLFLSDIIVNYGYFGKVTLFYDDIFWVYLAFALMVLTGSFIKRVSVLNVITAAIISVIIHWLLTNFGVWLGGKLYPRNLQGLQECYILAIPFEKNLLLGNLAYGGILYGGFEWAKRYFPSLKWSDELSN